MEQEKRQKEITRHGLIRVGLWLGGGWLLLWQRGRRDR